jgi:hypothetical protein
MTCRQKIVCQTWEASENCVGLETWFERELGRIGVDEVGRGKGDRTTWDDDGVGEKARR